MKLTKIKKIVSEVCGIPTHEMSSVVRKKELVQARNLYYILAKKNTNETLENIGNEVDRDHATTIHGIKTIKNDIETNYLNSAKLLKKCKRKIKESKIKTPIFRDISILLIKETNLIKLLIMNRINKLKEKIAHLEKQKPFKKGQKYCDLLVAIVNAKEKLNKLMYPTPTEL